MRKITLLFLSVTLFLASCEDQRFRTYTANVPVYMTYDELRSSFEVTGQAEINRPGKIYYKDQVLYLNEYREGIHVVDLSDPSDPEPKAFMKIPGNVDMAIRNNIVYADSYTDLVMVDITDPFQPVLIGRVEEVFEYMIPPHENDYPLDEIDEEKGVVIDFEVRKITRRVDPPVHPWPVYYDYHRLEMSAPAGNGGGQGAGNSYGVAGSMARFLTYDDYLYSLENRFKLKTIDISTPDEPVTIHEQSLWGNVETLFIDGETMYVGTSQGMHILSLSEPSVPILLSTYRHVTACDPVVVEGNLGYVTLRAGNNCGGTQNLLEVIDLSDKEDPERLVSYAMREPYGLGIDNGTLFVCEGSHGLKVFDASDPYRITSNQLAHFPDLHAFDVIPLSGILLMTGDDGFGIYDYSGSGEIRLLSTLP